MPRTRSSIAVTTPLRAAALSLVGLLSLSACSPDYDAGGKGDRITVTRFEVAAQPAPAHAPARLPGALLDTLATLWQPGVAVSTASGDASASRWLRLKVERLFPGGEARVLSVGGTVSLTLYGAGDGGPLRLRGYGLPDARALDKLSAEVDPRAWAIGAYLYVHVDPHAFLFENQPFDNTESVSVRTHPRATYHEVFSNWIPSEYLGRDAAFFTYAGGALCLALIAVLFAVLPLPGTSRRQWLYFAGYWLAVAAFWYGHTRTHAYALLPSMGAVLAVYIGSQLLMFGAYAVFVLEFVGGRRRYPRAYRYWRNLAVALALAAAVVVALLWFGYAPSLLYNGFVFLRIALALMGVTVSLYLLASTTQVFERLIAVGTLMFVLANVAVINTDEPWAFAFAMATELLVFGLAIGLRAYHERSERLLHQGRVERLKRDVTEARDTALRAQMNPHFVSNVINALRSLVLDGRNEEAYDYLSRFAHFVRVTLGSAKRNAITLAEELRVLEHYVALEELRHDIAIDLDVELAPGVDAAQLTVPPLILQPIVENAILHGFNADLERRPRIDVRFSVSGHDILAVVTDNGVGREAAAARSVRRERARESMAITIIRERLALFAGVTAGAQKEDRVTIDDLYMAGEPYGTAVLLRIRQRFVGDLDGDDSPSHGDDEVLPTVPDFIGRLLGRE